MDAKKLAQFHDDIGLLLHRYGLDGFAGVALKGGRPHSGIILYDPADVPTKLLANGLSEKIQGMLKDLRGCAVQVHTGMTGENAANN